jgi:hypothetical protein
VDLKHLLFIQILLDNGYTSVVGLLS